MSVAGFLLTEYINSHYSEINIRPYLTTIANGRGSRNRRICMQPFLGMESEEEDRTACLQTRLIGIRGIAI